MRVFFLLFYISSSIIFQSCKSPKDGLQDSKVDVQYMLSKSACFGKCPIFELSIDGKGYARYEGIANTDKRGIYAKQLTKDERKSLIQAFKNINFNQYKAVYPSQIADLPTIKVGYYNGETYKVVSGKEDRPESLMQLQFALEKIADSGGWKLIKSAKEIDQAKKPEVENIIDEIIIEPNPGTQMNRWLESMDKYGVRLIKKIAPGLNYYLITYNKDITTGDEFVKVLQRDPLIKSAEYNKKTKKRG